MTDWPVINVILVDQIAELSRSQTWAAVEIVNDLGSARARTLRQGRTPVQSTRQTSVDTSVRAGLSYHFEISYYNARR